MPSRGLTDIAWVDVDRGMVCALMVGETDVSGGKDMSHYDEFVKKAAKINAWHAKWTG